MPFYEYECSACGTQIEVLQKINDAPLKKCTGCGKNQLKKLVSAPVFRLKGGGWYETDFKTDQDRKRNLVDNDGDSGTKEAKPEASPEAVPKADSGAKPETSAKPAAAEKPAAKAGATPKRRAAKPAGGRTAAARKPAAAKGKAGATSRARV